MSEEPIEPDGLATCHTEGCDNAGYPIPVILQRLPDGSVDPDAYYECGVCWQRITDVVEMS